MFAACRAVADEVAQMRRGVGGAERVPTKKPARAEDDSSGDETTPTTTVSEADVGEFTTDDEAGAEEEPRQLRPGLFPSNGEDTDDEAAIAAAQAATAVEAARAAARSEATAGAEEDGAGFEDESAGFTPQETLFVFDWDDTILPSSWLNRQGLRLDSRSVVSAAQKERLAEVAASAAEMLRLAKQQGTVVLLTNAERGWIELSCTKFLPTLLPTIENVKIVSARTTYETPRCTSPLDWKVLAFEAEIGRACGTDTMADPSKRKNIHSLGDSIHEREALMRATSDLPNCCAKSLKFVERPDLSQVVKQHALVTGCFRKIVQHGGNLDLTINCP